MAAVTLPLREEHKELFPHVSKLREVADAVGERPTGELRKGLDEVLEFLSHHLIPHAKAEDKALYPVVQKAMGAAKATATMSRDHVEVGRLTSELAKLTGKLGAAAIPAAQQKDLRRLLYGLYALVALHFAKEEEIYLPLLDERLSADEARAMFDSMEKAAAEAKAR